MSNRRWTISLFIFCFFMVSCATRPPERAVPITVVVGPITFEAPVTKSTQIYTFEQEPDRDFDRQLLPTLINDIEVTAQRVLTEELAKQPGIRVIPFEETRRLFPDIAPAGQPLTDAQVQSLGQQTGADHVLTALIHDYGKVRWQYWVTGWLAHVAVATTIVGLATGWNPAAIGAYLAVDATTDFPLWYGGAEIFGWAFRPVRVHLYITQIQPCSGEIWSHDELVVKVPGKLLEQYPEDQQHLKQIQLEANLHKTLEDLTAEAGDILEVRPCKADNTATPAGSFSWASIFDLLL